MILLDANILLYAYDAAASQHIKARAWVETVFSDVEPVGLPWQSLSAFLRIMTDLRLPGKRFTVVEAAEFVNQWLEQPATRCAQMQPFECFYHIRRQICTSNLTL